MKKEVGASAGLLALLALFLHTQLPSPEKDASGNRDNAATAAKKDSGTPERIEDVDGPWLATRAFFHRASYPLRPQAASKAPKISVKEVLEDLTSPNNP